jgi:CHAT domain-containing protein
MAKSSKNPLKHLAGGFLLLGLYLGTLPTLATPTQVAQSASSRTPQTFTGRLDSNSAVWEEDDSYYETHTFEGQEGETVTITLSSEDFDTYLMLQAPTAETIAQNDDGTDGTNSQIIVTLPATGTYTVIANSYEAGETGNYRLELRTTTESSQASVTADESNEQVSSRTPQTFTGRLDSNSAVLEEDGSYYETHTFEGQEGETLTFTLSSEDFDTYLFLQAPTKETIARNDDSTDGTNSQIVVTLPATGTYTVIANSYEAGATGNYRLELRTATERDQALATAVELNQQAMTLDSEGRYTEAVPLAERALAIREEQLGENHHDVATSLNNLAALYREMGNYRKAEPLFQRALAIEEQALGSDHPDVANSLNNLAGVYSAMGNYTEAEPLYQRAIAIWEQSNHPRVAVALNNLANLYANMEKYREAEPLFQRSLAIIEKVIGSDNPDFANGLNNLANLYQEMGNYTEAEPLFQRSLAIIEKVIGSDNPDFANGLNNLANLYYSMGNYTEAGALYQRSLAIVEQAFGSDHPNVFGSLQNLANLHHSMGNYTEAGALYQRSLAIVEQAFGSDHPHVADSLFGLANLHYSMGNYTVAGALYQRSLTIWEQALGRDHPDVAFSLNGLAVLHYSMGYYTEAEPLYQRALAIWEQALGSDHPSVARSLNNLAGLYQAQGDITSATDYLSRSLSIQENNLSLIFTTGSEAQKQAYMNTLSGDTHQAISLHLQDASNNPEAAQLALTTLLRRKGRILDALTDNVQLIRDNLTPENQQLLDQLADTRTQLANLIYNKPENLSGEAYKTQVANLKAQANQLEAELSRRSAEFRTLSQPVTIAAVQQQIPADAALVELTLYKPYDAKAEPGQRWGEPRYAAYILHATGTTQWVDLGEAAPIDAVVKDLQNSLASQGSLDTLQETARDLDSLLMQPIRAKLGDKTHILLSPDSQLNLIPFAALVDENNQYLVENYQITYLTTGRDLLRLQNQQEPRQASVIIANPDYDEPGVNNSAVAFNRGENRLISGIDVLLFDPLPGTAAEADAIQPLLPNATVLTEAKATEQAIKQVEAPRILHIATHGFFIDVDLVAPSANLFDNRGPIASVRPRPGAEIGESAPINQENPLLRSGLALAGFNTRSSGGSEDGALTALEVAGLNLRGTKLVVLSACETGVGDVANGEGVYGLRRALAIAGAESQLISLWKVSDAGTKDLMVDYYQRLLSGEGRSDSLRQVQLAMLNSPNYQHPYFWASFIPSGEWAAME